MKSGKARCLRTLFVFLSLLASGGCSVKRPLMPAMATIQGIPGRFDLDQVVETSTGEVLSFEQLMDLSGEKDLVFVGEVHDNPDHHLIEVQILQALLARHGPLTVAMEFFQKPQQSILDEYMKGAIDEKQFLEKVNWRETWGFDYHFYRPLLLAVKAAGGRILAINAPREIIRKVARSGLDSLPQNERAQLATRIDLTDKQHREYLLQIYRQHTHQDLKNFEYFYQAQCAWEDTMAESIANELKMHKREVIAFTGNGHITQKFGIPDRVQSRIPVSLATIGLLPLDGPTEVEPASADFVWLTLSCSGTPLMVHPSMGKK
jgi:uncharacterized iron-regulated protein